MEYKLIDSETVILKQSLGKDAVLSLDILKSEGFNVINVYNAWIPNLPSDVEYIKYLNTLYTNMKWVVSVHRTTMMDFQDLSYMTLEATDHFFHIAKKYEDFDIDAETKVNYVKEKVPDAWLAIGLKKSDSPRRRVTLNKFSGNMNHSKKVVYPVAEYTNEQVWSELKARGIKLHPHYQMFGRSFEGLCGKYLPALYHYAEKDDGSRLHQVAKKDIEYIESIFPLAKAKYIQQKLLEKRIAYGKS